jgi:hypothetical protein
MSLALRTCLGLALVALVGCGGDAKPAVVQGRVTLGGLPMAGGTIVFTPDPERGGSGPLATAEIGPDGKYMLITEGQPGAVPGWHRVTVAPATHPTSSNPGTQAPSSFPAHYQHVEHSEQSYEVKPGIVNTIDIQLK